MMGDNASVAIATILALATVRLMRFEFTQMHMGVEVRLTLFAPDRATAERAGRAGFRRFSELDAALSDYQAKSEVNRLLEAQGPTKVSEDLFRVLSQAQRLAAMTNGAFDATAGPLVRKWREARRSGVKPTGLEEAKQFVGWRYVHLDPAAQTVEILKPGVKLDFGGIAKGDACDEAILAMRKEGVDTAMVEAGGDISVGEAPPGLKGWRILVRGGSETYELRYQAISTSGDSEQFVDIDGVRYSHVVDPRTGWGVTSRIQTTVIGPSGLLTDPLATALCVDPDSVPKIDGVRVILKRA